MPLAETGPAPLTDPDALRVYPLLGSPDGVEAEKPAPAPITTPAQKIQRGLSGIEVWVCVGLVTVALLLLLGPAALDGLRRLRERLRS